jgi:uncharacterized protein (DUF488 family)
VILHSIGHSTRTLEELIALLRENGVGLLVDVRRFPASRRHPHFARAALEAALAAAGIAYRHEPALGGHRQPHPRSPHTAWRNVAFRGYADHMDTPAFREALVALVDAARGRPTCVLCAEALPWRCHRQLIADALAARGVETRHILGHGRTESHRLHPAARIVEGARLLYAGGLPLE